MDEGNGLREELRQARESRNEWRRAYTYQKERADLLQEENRVLRDENEWFIQELQRVLGEWDI